MDPIGFEMSGREVDLATGDEDVNEETSFINTGAREEDLMLPDPPVLTPQQPQEIGGRIQNLRDELRDSELNERKRRLVGAFYEWVAEAYHLSPSKIPYDKFSIGEDGKTLHWTPEGGNEIPVTAIRGGDEFLALSTLAQKYGRGGADAIRKSLELPNYTSKTRKVLSARGEKAIQQ